MDGGLSPRQRELWFCLLFPRLPLEALRAAQVEEQAGSQAGAARAVIQAGQQPQRVLYACPTARRQGVEDGIALSTALALCPGLSVLTRDPEREQQCLQQLALRAYAFSPRVALFPATSGIQGLWLEMSGCERLCGNYSAWLAALAHALDSWLDEVHCGFGPSPEAARLLCRPGWPAQVPSPERLWQQLQQAPLGDWAEHRREQQRFEQLGLTRVGELLALPGAALGRRFGKALITRLERLCGQRPSPVDTFQPAATFCDHLHSPDGIGSKEGLLFPMKTLLQRFCHYLLARQHHCRSLHWRFAPLLGDAVSMTVSLSSSQNRSHSLLQLSRLHLERLVLPGSIELIELYSDDFVAAPVTVDDLFDPPRGSDAELLDQLSARLGPQALARPCSYPEPLPEQASRLADSAACYRPADDSHPTPGHLTPAPPGTPVLPTVLLPQAEALREHAGQLHWHSPLTLLRGPHRLRGNWWQGEQQRDYYLAIDQQQRRCWIYRDSRSGQWFIQGLFT